MSEFSRAEAIDVLAQCALMEDSIKSLRIKAHRTLNRPYLKLVESKDAHSNSSSRIYSRPISG